MKRNITHDFENFDDAPQWADRVLLDKTQNTFVWSDGAMYAPILRNPPRAIHDENQFEIVAERPVQSNNNVIPVQTKLIMTPKAANNSYEEFIANGWDDDQLVENGYATRINDDRLANDLRWSPLNVETQTITAPIDPLSIEIPTVSLLKKHNYIVDKGYTFNDEIRKFNDEINNTFTPVQQQLTAPDLLKQAAQLLAERGQQYDKSGNERSAAKIVAAFNAVTGRDLTPGEGWLFLVMLKAVRFYSNTETPHRDSLEDMIAYAALHAEEYLNDK